MQPSVFKFEWSMEAANFNWTILERHDLNVHAALQQQSHTQLGFGSEFRTNYSHHSPATTHYGPDYNSGFNTAQHFPYNLYRNLNAFPT
jgi:hypothetical protein